MARDDDIVQQTDLLTMHRRRLAVLLRQQAHFGAAWTPPHIVIDIDDVRTEIQRIKTVLHDWGVEVEDLPDEEESSTTKPSSAVGKHVAPITVLSPTTPRPAVSNGSIFQVPFPPNPLFVDREHELVQLAQLLEGTTPIAVLPAIVGTGGMGKTQLAAEFAHRYRDHFPAGIFWLAMERANNVADQVAACAGPGGLDLPGFSAMSFAERITATRIAWQQPERRLLVFDNLEDPALLREWCPRSGGSRVLITSRRVTWTTYTGITPQSLPPLMRPASLELLLQPRAVAYRLTIEAMLMEPATAAAAHAICTVLGDLPLALALAGAYLGHYLNIDLKVYLAQIQANPLAHPSLDALLDEGLPTDHAPSITATFAFSYEQLQQNDPTDALALALLQAASMCAPTTIPVRLLLRAAGMDPDGEVEQRRSGDALWRLTGLGLLELGGVAQVRLHRLLATFVRARSDSGQIAISVAQALIAEAKQAEQVSNLFVAGVYREHIRIALERPGLDELLTASLQTALANILRSEGNYVAAQPLYERALAIHERVLGPDHPDTATSLTNLALLLSVIQGHMGLFAQSRRIGRKHLLLSVTQAREDPTRVRAMLERALTVRERTLGPEHPDTAANLQSLGSVLSVIGDHTGARNMFERAVAINERTLGTDHVGLAASLSYLATELLSQGDLEKAQTLYERAFAIRERALGSEHPDTATTLSSLASLRLYRGDYRGARSLHERVLVIQEQTIGPNHPQTATTLNSLALLLRVEGDFVAASALYERTLAIREQTFEPDHPHVNISLAGLIECLEYQDECLTAYKFLKTRIAAWELRLGHQHRVARRYLRDVILLWVSRIVLDIFAGGIMGLMIGETAGWMLAIVGLIVGMLSMWSRAVSLVSWVMLGAGLGAVLAASFENKGVWLILCMIVGVSLVLVVRRWGGSALLRWGLWHMRRRLVSSRKRRRNL